MVLAIIPGAKPSKYKGNLSVKKTSAGENKSKVTGKDPIKVNYGEQYTKDGHTYKTDSKGRISSCESKLQLGEGKRNNYAQKVVGREDRLPDDEGGHLIASIFKGSGNMDNLIPMNGNLNKGEWKKLENMWAKQLNKGKSVEVKIKPIYKGDLQRPDSFKIEYKIGNKDWEFTDLKNKPGGK